MKDRLGIKADGQLVSNAPYRVVDDGLRQRYVQQACADKVHQTTVGLGPEDTVRLPLSSHRRGERRQENTFRTKGNIQEGR